MDIYQALRKDHQKVREILNTLCNTTDRAEQKRERLFHELKNEIEIHTRLEEQLFYAPLKEKNKTRPLIMTAFEEHLLAANLLNELDKLPFNTEQWTAKLGVLKENVERHIEEEENELFPQARSVFSEDKAEEIGNTFAYKKEEMLTVL